MHFLAFLLLDISNIKQQAVFLSLNAFFTLLWRVNFFSHQLNSCICSTTSLVSMNVLFTPGFLKPTVGDDNPGMQGKYLSILLISGGQITQPCSFIRCIAPHSGQSSIRLPPISHTRICHPSSHTGRKVPTARGNIPLPLLPTNENQILGKARLVTTPPSTMGGVTRPLQSPGLSWSNEPPRLWRPFGLSWLAALESPGWTV